MKKELSTYEAADMLLNDENANWSAAGSVAMVEYLEGLEEDLSETIEFDIVAIRCDYTEYANLVEWHENYFGLGYTFADTIGADENADDDEVLDAIREYIADRGQLIEFGSGVIISSF